MVAKPVTGARNMKFDPEREAAGLEEYLGANKALIDDIEQHLRSRGVPDDALDEMVHSASDNIDPENSGASSWASDSVNNEGFRMQIAFILQENGIEEGRVMIEEAAAAAMGPANQG